MQLKARIASIQSHKVDSRQLPAHSTLPELLSSQDTPKYCKYHFFTEMTINIVDQCFYSEENMTTVKMMKAVKNITAVFAEFGMQGNKA